jgi:type IX secretion system PorP/SprF family membrane protein
MQPFISSAQENDWYDSIQKKKADRDLKREIRRNDTTLYYQPNLTVGMFNHFKDNPGFCGFEQKFKYNSAFQYDIPFYKAEYPSFHPMSYFFSFEASGSKKRKSGIGACFYNIRSGPSLMTVLNCSYSYKIHFGKYNDLRFGASVEFFTYSLDFERLTFPDMISKLNGFVFNTAELWPGELTKRSLNFNAGLAFSRKHFYAGFSVLNITKPDIAFISLYRMPRHYLISSGYTFILSPKVELSPSAQLRFVGKEFTANVHLTGVFWKHFIAGLSLNELTTASVDLGCSFWNILTFYASTGTSTQSELYHHFGPLDYVSANLHVQLGKYQEKF